MDFLPEFVHVGNELTRRASLADLARNFEEDRARVVRCIAVAA